ncbi:MAG TPA: glycosyltransferase family 4 protein [Chitinophagaceae bacterium]|nr:glycosyltransferase family 4 protein [Chitinophagaceae bacterium]
MRLLYITNGINGSGGLERVLSIKASLLAEKYNYTIGILVLNDAHKNPFYDFSPAISFFSVPAQGNPLSYLKAYKKGIQKVVDTFNADIISVCDDGLKGFFLPKWIKTNAKWIYERHASIHLNTGNDWKSKLKRKGMFSQIHNFDKFVVLTASNIAEWKKENVIAIPNLLSFQSNKTNDLESKNIIVVGSHSWNKGYDLLIKAWKEIEKSYTNWSLTIYGKIDKEETFIHMAKKEKLQNMHFHPPVSNIQEKYLESAFLVLPSRSEGFGMVLIEAMECGLPCVSFDCPSGPRDIIKEGEDGFLVAPEDTEALAEKMIYLIENPEKRKEMGIKAKKNVQRFQAESIVADWHALFQDLARGN